jgi:hypothetical protein
LEAYWKPLIEQAAKLTHGEFADLFIERMVSGLMMLYAEAAPRGKHLVVDEFKKVLTSYLGTIVYQEEARAK